MLLAKASPTVITVTSKRTCFPSCRNRQNHLTGKRYPLRAHILSCSGTGTSHPCRSQAFPERHETKTLFSTMVFSVKSNHIQPIIFSTRERHSSLFESAGADSGRFSGPAVEGVWQVCWFRPETAKKQKRQQKPCSGSLFETVWGWWNGDEGLFFLCSARQRKSVGTMHAFITLLGKR